MVKGVMDFYKAIFVSRIKEETEISFQLRFYIFIISLSYTSAKLEGLLLWEGQCPWWTEEIPAGSGSFHAIIYFRLHVCCCYALFTPPCMQYDKHASSAIAINLDNPRLHTFKFIVDNNYTLQHSLRSKFSWIFHIPLISYIPVTDQRVSFECVYFLDYSRKYTGEKNGPVANQGILWVSVCAKKNSQSVTGGPKHSLNKTQCSK